MATTTSNPVLGRDTFGYASDRSQTMTVDGVILKTAILLALVIAGAVYTWMQFFKGSANVELWMTGGAIGGFVLALVTVFKKEWAPVTAPIYALLEGFFIGGLSAVLEVQFQGIAFQAAIMTFGTLAAMLGLYQSGLIKVNDTFRMVVATATGGIFLAYLISFVLSFFGIHMPFIYSNGLMGIGFSLVVVGVAALNLVLDFDFIERGANRSPKYMEWFGAFALMVTLIWLYVEFLRLLSKLRSK